MKKIRLQKLISDAGIMSRRAAEEQIKAGKVTVNGHPASLGDKADYKDVVVIGGKRISFAKKEYTYIIMNKPRGYVCTTSDERGRKCVTDLLKGVDLSEGKYDICVANIVADIIIRMLPDVDKYLKPSAPLILSGIIGERAEEVKACALKYGFKIEKEIFENDWVGLLVRK